MFWLSIIHLLYSSELWKQKRLNPPDPTSLIGITLLFLVYLAKDFHSLFSLYEPGCFSQKIIFIVYLNKVHAICNITYVNYFSIILPD